MSNNTSKHLKRKLRRFPFISLLGTMALAIIIYGIILTQQVTQTFSIIVIETLLIICALALITALISETSIHIKPNKKK